MKKKIFTLLMLLVAVCSGAWAEDETLFSFTMTATADVTMAAKTTGTVDLITDSRASLGVSGTAVSYFQGQSTNSAVKYIEKKQQDKVDGTNLRWTSNDSYMLVTLATGKTLQAGDVITWNSWNNAYTVEFSFTKGSTRATTPATSSKRYVVASEDGICGENAFYVWRATGSTAGLHDLTITRPDASRVQDPEISQDGNTITIETTTVGANIYYTTNGTDPTTSSTHYTEPFDIAADCTVKAIAVKDGMDDSDIASRFCGADVAIASNTTINFGDTGWTIGQRRNGVYLGEGCSLNATSGTVDGITFTKRIQFGGGSRTNTRYASFKVNAPCYIVVYVTSNSSNSLRGFGISKGVDYDKNVTIEKIGYNYGGYLDAVYYAVTGTGLTKVNISNTGDSDIGIYGFKVVYGNTNSHTMSIGSAGYSTLCLPYAVTIPSGITAYTGTVNASSVTLNQINDDIIPANTAVVLEGSAGSYTFSQTTSAGTASSDLGNGCASDSKVVKDETDSYYVLYKDGDDVLRQGR
jgi:hypothetical protein